jgi:o-succinylbenzoate synthase
MIASIKLDRIAIPLTHPYQLSTVTVEEFDVIIVRIQLTDGRSGIGEVTSLEGYSAETGEQAWTNLRTVGRHMPGLTVDDAISHVESELSAYPFSATGLCVGLETAARFNWQPVTTPMVGILSAQDPPAERHRALVNQIRDGFRTIKVKVGFDPHADAAVLDALIKDAPKTVAFRVDANQGYSLADARIFLAEAPVDRIDHIEQPLPVGQLTEHATLVSESPIDIILDEDVATVEDLEAIEQTAAADGVKFKLMKCGSFRQARHLLQDATRRGFTVIFGNGVQSDIGCLIEATVFEQVDIETVGEFNGWRKQSTTLLEDGPSFADGCLRWNHDSPSLDTDTIDRFGIDSARFEISSS